MFEIHLLDSRRADAQLEVANAATCTHGNWLSTDGDAIRCCECLSQLVMLPHRDGEFRLVWLSPSKLATRPVKWAA